MLTFIITTQNQFGTVIHTTNRKTQKTFNTQDKIVKFRLGNICLWLLSNLIVRKS